jgi:hypothetical protein
MTPSEVRTEIERGWVEPDRAYPMHVGPNKDLFTAEQYVSRVVLLGPVEHLGSNRIGPDEDDQWLTVVEVDGYRFGWIEEGSSETGYMFVRWVWAVEQIADPRWAPADG